MKNRRKEAKCSSRRKVIIMVGLLVVTVLVIAVLLAVFLRRSGEESCPSGQTKVTGRVLNTARIPVKNVKISAEADPDIILGISDNKGLFKVCLANITDILQFSRQGYVSLSDLYEGSSVDIELKPYVPLYMRRQPVSQSRVVGGNATLCCEATGSPPPDYYQWSTDGSVLENTTSGQLILSELQTSNSGQYRCTAVNTYSRARSQVAEITVKEDIDDFCPSLPLPNLQSLPAGTTLVSNGEAFYDAGTCGQHKCGGTSGTGKCDDDGSDGLCCGPTSREKRNFEVKRSGHSRHNIALTVITECGCTACKHMQVTIYGYVSSGKTKDMVSHVQVGHRQGLEGETDEDGHYSLQVMADAKRVVIRFLPAPGHMEVSKVVHIPVGMKGGIRQDVILPPAADPISLDPSQENMLEFKGQEDRNVGFITLPANSFYSEEGNVYSGIVKATVSTIDTSDPESYSSAPSDLSIVGPDGDEMGLSSYGMIGMIFKDKQGKPLSIADEVRIEVPEEVVGEEGVKLWSLNSETGYWEYLADLELETKEAGNRKRRQSRRSFVSRTGIPANRVWLNLDKPFPICYVKVRAFRNDQMNELEQMENVEVILLTQNPMDSNRWARYTTAVTSGKNGACVSSLCESEGAMKGSIFARHVGGRRRLRPAHPANHSTGLPDERMSQLQYEVDDDAIRTKLEYSNGAPFYFRDRSACVAAKYTDPHFRFFYEDYTHEDCHYEVDEYLTEADTSLIGTDDELQNLMAFYPKVRSNYEVCYIKVTMGELFLREMETNEATGAFMTTDSYAGSIIPWHENTTPYQYQTFGTRESCFLGNHACMEYKKSGLSYDGKTTILTSTNSRLFYKSSQRECRFTPNEQIRTDFSGWEYGNSPIPERMQDIKYGVYCSSHPVLQEAKDLALGYCYAGSKSETSQEMKPEGAAFTYCHDDCKSSPCINGGVCFAFQHGYQCECPQLYSVGHNCEDWCATQPCLNNATCQNSNPWSNWRPQKRDVESQTRRRTRQVEELNNEEFYCHCQDGYQGVRCEEYVKYNMCWGGHCRYGECTSVGFDYECNCPRSYYGHDCQVFSYEDPCSVGGEEWLKPVCENNGTCSSIRNADGQYHPSCVCPQGYEGQYCHLRIEWKDNRCLNPKVQELCVHGECNWDAASDKLCICNEGFTGPICAHRIVS